MSRLAACSRSGDKEAFAELVKLTFADTYGLALRLTQDAEDAGDVVQETYLRAFRSIRTFRGDAAFTTWLYRITANCASSHLARRTRDRHERLDEDASLADHAFDADPELVASAALDHDRISKAVAGLPASLRAVIVLRDVYDLPNAAIADELGISQSAAKVRLHRARKMLRERLFAALPQGASGGGLARAL